MFPVVLSTLLSVGADVAKSLFPKPEDELKRLELTARLNEAMIAKASAIEQAAADIIKAEAQGQSWLQRNWRPLTMVVFVTLIVCRWFGFVAPNLSQEEYLKLWSIVEFGLGGYVVGRSAETVAKTVSEALRK